LKCGRNVDLSAITPKKVQSEIWSNDNEAIKSRIIYDDKLRNDFNNDITSLKAAILKSLETTELADVNKVWLETEIDKYYRPKKYLPIELAPQSFFEFIEQFIKEAPHRTGKKDGTLISSKAVTQYQISFDYLKEFAKYKKKKSFEYAEMNKAFYDS